MVLAVFFFIPYALLTAELGAAFTEEGGAYIWTRMSYGRFTAAINAVFYWFSNPIWIGATLALLCCAAIQGYFYSFDRFIVYYIVGLAFIWFSVYSAILSFGSLHPFSFNFFSDFLFGNRQNRMKACCLTGPHIYAQQWPACSLPCFYCSEGMPQQIIFIFCKCKLLLTTIYIPGCQVQSQVT